MGHEANVIQKIWWWGGGGLVEMSSSADLDSSAHELDTLWSTGSSGTILFHGVGFFVV